ncbi:hypothetical protein BDD12DRAFT_984524 [Trichophaea hybrida]|nr:hypothetical protein BDD12DRAFT_984524 [Trichophaea hybrida]
MMSQSSMVKDEISWQGKTMSMFMAVISIFFLGAVFIVLCKEYYRSELVGTVLNCFHGRKWEKPPTKKEKWEKEKKQEGNGEENSRNGNSAGESLTTLLAFAGFKSLLSAFSLCRPDFSLVSVFWAGILKSKSRVRWGLSRKILTKYFPRPTKPPCSRSKSQNFAISMEKLRRRKERANPRLLLRTKVPMSQVFDTDEAVKPMLEFLLGTEVGGVTGVREGDDVEEAEEGGSSSEEE